MKKSTSALLALALLASCAPRGSSQKDPNPILSRYFSMRQQTPTQYVGILQLQLPALLTSAQTEKGKVVVDEELKKLSSKSRQLLSRS